MRRLLAMICLAGLVAGVASGSSIAGKPGTGLSVDPVRLSFGRVLVGSYDTLGVTVTNTTNSPIIYQGGWSRTGDAVLSFAGFGSECLAVQPGATCSMDTGFEPTEAGHFRATITVVFDTGPGQSVSASWSASGGAYMPRGGF